MKNFSISTIVASAIGIIVAIFALWAFGSYIIYNNQEVMLRNESEAQIKNIEGAHDKMWKIISQKAQISNEYKESFDTIYTNIMSARYQLGNSDGSLMKWIKESNPQFDVSLYKDLSNSIEIYRTEFQIAQKRMVDICNRHKDLITTMPSSWFIKNNTPIEYNVISSTNSKTVMQTGIDDDTNLFKK